jgi:CRP-like cAMP-binding protein
MTLWEVRPSELPQTIELVRGLKPHERDMVLGSSRRRRFRAKSVMTYQGEPADYLLLLWNGRARYFYEAPHAKKLILKWILPGDIFGGAALVSEPSKYLVSTEAVRDSIVLEWDGPTIRRLARQFPQLLENSQLINMEYVAWYVAAHAALSFQSARKRLASVLFGLAKTIGQKAGTGIEVDVTNEELSESANITPFTASRLISGWQRSGSIRKHRGKIVLLSPDTFLSWSDRKFPAGPGRTKKQTML